MRVTQPWSSDAVNVQRCAHLVLLALVVQVPVTRQLGLGLVLEEGVVQHLVVDVYLAHLGADALARLGLALLGGLLLHHRVADLRDARLRDELGQLEGRLLHAHLACQVLTDVAPVSGHGHAAAVGLQGHQQARVAGSHVVRLHHIRPRNELLQFCYTQST